MASCDNLCPPPGGKGGPALLAQADSLMASQPDSAYNLLIAADSAHRHWRRADRMRYELTLAEAMNKAYRDFTTDSVLKQVVRYYDRHGSRDQQLKARYLLGCAYRDMGEAPAAINAWQEAVEKADTTSTDCDYNTLYRVYGQMADMYYRQYLPQEELIAREQYARYALRSGDTLSYIRGLLLRNEAYQALGDTLSIYKNTEQVRHLYLRRGLRDMAAQAYATAIHLLIENGQYLKARTLMDVFEHESGLFDVNGNIEPRREYYYYDKGIYYLEVNQLDSAEEQFRRLLSRPDNLLNSYHGLMALYKTRNNVDSTFKYSTLYETAISDNLRQVQSEAVVKAQRLYNYNRQQQVAREQEAKAQRRKIMIIGLITILFFGALYYSHKRKLREKELIQTTNSYLQAKSDLDIAKKELAFLGSQSQHLEEARTLLKSKELQVKRMAETLRHYEKLFTQPAKENDEEELVNSDIVRTLRRICNIQTYKENNTIKLIQPRACNEEEWQELVTTIKKYHYTLFHLITHTHHLPRLQFKVCILSRLGFTSGEISTLLGTTTQNVSNARSKATKRLFDSTDTSLLDTQLPFL